MNTPRRTSLYAFHAARGARFVDFAGWEMPVQYRSILEEHRAVRTTAGMFDVSHMGEIGVYGPAAADLIDTLVTNDVASMTPGRVVYTPMCNRMGGVIDDLLVYRRSETEFLLCVNASNTGADFDWIHSRGEGSGCSIIDESARWGLLAVQGPNAEAILQSLTSVALADIRYYHFVSDAMAGVPCLISRTGYTGEKGFELFCPSDEAEKLALAIEKSGGSHGLVLCGLGARDSLRLEAGFSLYGHEIDKDISPLQAGLGWTVKLNKTAFIGRDALATEKAEKPAAKVLFFRTGDRRIVRPGTTVLTDSIEVGRVLSGTLSPMLNEAIGSALVESRFVDNELSVDLRGQRVVLQVVKPPFVPLKK